MSVRVASLCLVSTVVDVEAMRRSGDFFGLARESMYAQGTAHSMNTDKWTFDPPSTAFSGAKSHLETEVQTTVYLKHDMTQVQLNLNASLSGYHSAEFDVEFGRLSQVVSDLDTAVGNARTSLATAAAEKTQITILEDVKQSLCNAVGAHRTLTEVAVDISCDETDPDCTQKLSTFQQGIASASNSLAAQVASGKSDERDAVDKCSNASQDVTTQIGVANAALQNYKQLLAKARFYRRRNLFLHCRSGKSRFATCGKKFGRDYVVGRAESNDQSDYSVYHRKNAWNALNMSWCIMNVFPDKTGEPASTQCKVNVNYLGVVGDLNYHQDVIDAAVSGKPCDEQYLQTYVRWDFPSDDAEVTAELDGQFVRGEESDSLNYNDWGNRDASDRWAFNRCQGMTNDKDVMGNFIGNSFGESLTQAELDWFTAYHDWRGPVVQSVQLGTASGDFAQLAQGMPQEPTPA